MDELPDAVFASGAMGRGIAIDPTSGSLYSPVSGRVTFLYSTMHAIGVTSDEGVEVLIHIGMDTVKLGGRHFTAFVGSGAAVGPDDLLLEFDAAAIQAAGFSLLPILFTNLAVHDVVLPYPIRTVQRGDELATVVRRRPAA